MYSLLVLTLCTIFLIDDDLPTPVSSRSRQSIAEKDDHLPPLRPVPASNRRMQKRTLVSTHSDAADSAVSMVISGCYGYFCSRRSMYPCL